MNKKATALILLLLVSVSVSAQTCFDLLDEDTQNFIQSDEEAMAAFEGTQLGTTYYVFELSQGEDYYLVPCNKETGTTAIVKLDANQGYFEAVTWMEQPTKYLPVTESEAVRTIEEMINPQPIKGLTIEFDFNGGVKTHLEWIVGEYSQDPFKPYRVLQAEDGKWVIDQKANLYELSAFTSSKPDTNAMQVEGIPPNSSGFMTIGNYYEITNPDLNNGSFQATLTFSYPDTDQDSIVDWTSINENELNVYYYEEGQGWQEIANPDRNTTKNTIAVEVNHFTMFALMVEEPPPAPQPPTPPQNTGGSGPLGGGGGGGTSAKLEIRTDGNCTNQEITLTTLNMFGNPAANAKITVTKEGKVVQEKTTSQEGTATFTFEEPGEYRFIATKRLYTVNSKTIQIEECTPEEPAPEPQEPEPQDLPEEPKPQNKPETNQNNQVEIETTGTGLITLENNPAINAALAGLLTALALGTILYAKKKRRKIDYS